MHCNISLAIVLMIDRLFYALLLLLDLLFVHFFTKNIKLAAFDYISLVSCLLTPLPGFPLPLYEGCSLEL